VDTYIYGGTGATTLTRRPGGSVPIVDPGAELIQVLGDSESLGPRFESWRAHQTHRYRIVMASGPRDFCAQSRDRMEPVRGEFRGLGWGRLGRPIWPNHQCAFATYPASTTVRGWLVQARNSYLLLGHASVKTTERAYAAFVKNERFKQTIDLLDTPTQPKLKIVK
jgi:hypothetical protein